jgi:hypothetical protein
VTSSQLINARLSHLKNLPAVRQYGQSVQSFRNPHFWRARSAIRSEFRRTFASIPKVSHKVLNEKIPD